jgi:hypothetical protein
MMDGEIRREPTAAEALDRWRQTEREVVRSTAQREAAEVALQSARLAEEAADATARAADAASHAAAEASRAATATADAARRVLAATSENLEAKRVQERDARTAEAAAKASHHDAVARASDRIRTEGRAGT